MNDSIGGRIWEVQFALRGPRYMDLRHKARGFAEIAYFVQRRRINGLRGVGSMTAIITE